MISVHHEPGGAICRPSGEVDASNAGHVPLALDVAVSAPVVIVDLSEVTSVDSAGIGVMASGARRPRPTRRPDLARIRATVRATSLRDGRPRSDRDDRAECGRFSRGTAVMRRTGRVGWERPCRHRDEPAANSLVSTILPGRAPGGHSLCVNAPLAVAETASWSRREVQFRWLSAPRNVSPR